jgi:hypothetical protein
LGKRLSGRWGISSYFIPIAKPKQKKPQQEEMAFHEWTSDRLKVNKFIHQVREKGAVLRNARLLVLVLSIALLLTACQERVPIPLPDPDEVELDPHVVEPADGTSGSAEITITHGIEYPLGDITIDETFLLLIQRFTEEPRAESSIHADTDGVMEINVTGIGEGGSHTTLATVPVNYVVEGTFYPYPRCEFEVQITEYIAYSTPVEVNNTLFGELPGGLGEDLVTFLPTITLRGPNYYDASMPSLVVSISAVVLEGDSGCMFMQ